MYDKDKIVALGDHPVRHIPKFGGLGVSLCGILSYSWQREKPVCIICQEAQAKIKATKRKRNQ